MKGYKPPPKKSRRPNKPTSAPPPKSKDVILLEIKLKNGTNKYFSNIRK